MPITYSNADKKSQRIFVQYKFFSNRLNNSNMAPEELLGPRVELQIVLDIMSQMEMITF